VGPRLVKEFNVVGKIDGNPSTVGGLLGDCKRRALNAILMKEYPYIFWVLGTQPSLALATKT